MGRTAAGRLSVILLVALAWFAVAVSRASAAVSPSITLGAGQSRAAVLPLAEAAATRNGPFVPFAQFEASGRPVSYWLRFTIRPAGPGDSARWLLTVPRGFVRADFYHADGSLEKAGMDASYAQRASAIGVPSFRIRKTDYGRMLLLHVAYYRDTRPDIGLITEHAFFVSTRPYQMIEGLFLGVLLAVAFFNLFLFGVTRERSALWYVAFIGALLVNEVVATGLGDQYLWPDAAFDIHAVGYVTSFLCFTAFFFFERDFLRTKTEARGLDRVLLVTFGVYAAVQGAQTVLAAGGTVVELLFFVQVASMLVTAAIALARLRAGFSPARYFVLGFIPSTIGVGANLYYLTFAPSGNWFWASNGVEVGTMIQSIILSFSVVDRLRMLQHETRRTRSELTAVSAHAKKMQTLALFDPLTGLSNRIRFTDDLHRALQRRAQDGKRFAVLYCDLDAFKNINDDFGHRFGDEVLKIVAARLGASLRGQDLIARLGGDEFAVLLEFVSSPAQADHVSEMLAHLLDEPVVVDGKIMPIGISVGRAVYPDDGETMDALLHVADLRMYAMKQRRKASA